MLTGLSSFPATGDEHVAGGGPGPPATTSRPSLLNLLRRRAQVADGIGTRLLTILDGTNAIAEEAKHRIRGPVQSFVAKAAPTSRGGASSAASTATTTS